MSTHYNTEPTATASATLHTTLGPLHIALFASQTPLTCRNFLQHIQDNYYTGTIFHRIIPNFILQGGDPTGTGSGGTSIYEEPEFEYDATARDPNEKVVLRDELHSRLRFNRRGLVGMAKAEDGSYGSQFFITLGDASRELNGQCTMFGRIEGDSIYNVLKIAEGEVVEGTERPVYPVRVTGCEVGELGPLEGKIVKRDLTARVSATTAGEAKGGKKAAQTKKKGKAKGGKTLLSFGDDEGEEGEEMPVRPAKPKYNAALVTDTTTTTGNGDAAPAEKKKMPKPRKTSPSPPPQRKRASPTPPPIDRPKTPDPATQLPLRDPESPERSPSPEQPAQQKSKLERTNAEIESLKASMRRTVTTESDNGRKKSALEAMIPQTAIRGRKRPPPGSSASTSASNGITGFSSTSDNAALKMFNAFKAKLENADSTTTTTTSKPHPKPQKKEKQAAAAAAAEEEEEDEESQLCDLHFIVNCQSCKSWSDNNNAANTDAAAGGEATQLDDDDDDTDQGWLTHQLRFGKDTLGKDLKWKTEHPDDVDSLMVIDPREKEKDIVASGSGSGRKKRGMMERDRERDRKRGKVGDLEWRK